MERDEERGLGKEVNKRDGTKIQLSEKIPDINPNVMGKLLRRNIYGPSGVKQATCVDHLGRIVVVPYGFTRNYRVI